MTSSSCAAGSGTTSLLAAALIRRSTASSGREADPYTEADAREFVESQEARLTAGDVHFAVVEPRRSDTVRGGVLLRGVDFVDRRAVLGYWIEPRARGQLATHAVRLLARWASMSSPLRAWSDFAPDNDASSRVAERCGFVRQGLLRSWRRAQRPPRTGSCSPSSREPQRGA